MLAPFIGKLGATSIRPYAADIKTACVALYNSKETSKVKLATFDPITKLIEIGLDDAATLLDVKGLFNLYFTSYIQQTTKLTAVVQDSQKSQLLRFFVQSLETLFAVGKEMDMQLIVGAMIGINHYLVANKTVDRSYVQLLFNCTKHVIQPIDDLSRYDLPRAGLQLLVENASLFEGLLLNDARFLFDQLEAMSAHSNRDMSRLGMRALEQFLKCLSDILVKNPLGREEQSCFSIIVGKLDSKLKHTESSVSDISLAIRAFGFLAKPCKVFWGTDDLVELTKLMLQRSSYFYADTAAINDDQLSHIPSFLASFAYMAREMDEIIPEFVATVKRIVDVLLNLYPKIGAALSFSSTASLLLLLWTLHETHGNLFSIWQHAAYHAIVLTSTDIDPSNRGTLLDATATTMEQAYKDYLPFWRHVFDVKRLTSDTAADESAADAFMTILYDELMRAMLRLPSNLDFTIVEQQDDADADLARAAEGQQQPSTSAALVLASAGASDSAKVSAVKPKDFRILVNFVEFAQSFLLGPQKKRLEPWLPVMGGAWIELSNRHPLVSGFYTLFGVCLRASVDLGVFEPAKAGQVQSACKSSFGAHVEDVLVRMQPFKDELLASCLSLVLSSPLEIIGMSRLQSAMRMALTLGLSHAPLAIIALDALDRWVQTFDERLMQSVFREVLPPLAEYLTTDASPVADSVEAATESDASKQVEFRIANLRRKRFKNLGKSHIRDPTDLRNIQHRIVMLLGRIGGHNQLMLAGADPEGKISWNREQPAVLYFDVPYRDTNARIFLDDLLPRIAHLVEFSADRKTKVAAAELMHSLIIVMLGRSAFGMGATAGDTKSKFHYIHDKVFPLIIRLSIDVEKVTRDLFQPLTLQLIRWLTRSARAENPETMIMLTACMDAATSDRGQLRDFGAECVAEFLRYAIKNTTPDAQERNPTNAASLFKRIRQLCQHSSAQKRMGACMIFNRIYRIFREEEALVDIFSFELLHSLLWALRLADTDHPSIGSVAIAKDAISHMVKIIAKCKGLFMVVRPDRRAFPGLEVADLAHLVRWMFAQIGRHELEYARQCMQLFDKFAPMVFASAQAALQTYLAEDPGFLDSLFTPSSLYTLPSGTLAHGRYRSWLRQLCVASDAYLFLLDANLFPPQSVADNGRLMGPLAFLARQGASVSSIDDLKTLVDGDMQCVALFAFAAVRLLMFVDKILSTVPAHDALAATSSVFFTGVLGEPLCKVVATAIFSPAALGFEAGGSSSRAAGHGFEPVLRRLLSTLHVRLGHGQRTMLVQTLSAAVDPQLLSLGNLDDAVAAAGRKRLLHGLALLSTTSWLKEMELAGVLANLQEGLALIATHPTPSDPAVIEVLGLFIKVCMACTDSRLAVCRDLLHLETRQAVPAAVQIYQRFQTTIDVCIAAKLEVYAPHFEVSWESPQAQLVFSGMLDTLIENRAMHRHHIRAFNASLPRCTSMLRMLFQLQDAKNTVVVREIFEKLCLVAAEVLAQDAGFLRLMTTEFLYLTGVQFPLAVKASTAQLLVLFAGLDGSHEDEVARQLQDVVSQQFTIAPNDMKPFKGTERFHDYTTYVRNLLSALSHLGSPAIGRVILMHLCRDGDSMFTRQIQWRMNGMGRRLIPEKLDAFTDMCVAVLMDETLKLTIRSNIVRDALIPVLMSARAPVVAAFFVRHIAAIMGVIVSSLETKKKFEGLKTDLAIKAACYGLVEMAYLRLSVSDIHSRTGCVVTAFTAPRAPAEDKALTMPLIKSAHAAKSEMFPAEEPEELAPYRLAYHQAAYAALSAAMCKTQTKPSMFKGLLFAEDPAKGLRHWTNLADLNADVAGLLAFSTKANQGRYSSVSRMQSGDGVKYMSSVYLRDSSLSQSSLGWGGDALAAAARQPAGPDGTRDAAQQPADGFAGGTAPSATAEPTFTMPTQAGPSGVVAGPATGTASTVVAAAGAVKAIQMPHETWILPHERELSDVVVRTLAIAQQVVIQEGSNPMPLYTAELLNKMKPDVHFAIRVMIAKVVMSYPDHFAPFGKQFWRPLAQLLAEDSMYATGGLSSLSQEIVIQLILWSTDAATSKKKPMCDAGVEDRQTVHQMLRALCMRAAAPTKSGIANHVKLIRELIESFLPAAIAPTDVILGHLRSPDKDAAGKNGPLTGIYIASAFLSNGVPLWSTLGLGAETLAEGAFLDAIVVQLKQARKEVFAAAAELIGQLLTHLASESSTMQQYLLKAVKRVLAELPINGAGHNTDKFVVILNHITRQYPGIADGYVSELFFALCIETITSVTDKTHDMFRDLRAKDLLSLLAYRDEECQTHTLSLLIDLVPVLELGDAEYFIGIVVDTFAGHSSDKCRQAYYTLVVRLVQRWKPEAVAATAAIPSSNDDDADMDEPVDNSSINQRVCDLVDRLGVCILRGLNDPSDDIRRQLVDYVERQFLGDITIWRRTEQIFKAMYSPETEDSFLQYASHFLLEASKPSAGYSAVMFPSSLADIKFTDLAIDTSWNKSTTMQPMFASQAPALEQEVDEDGDIDMDMQVRATVDMQWTPTLEMSAMSRRSLFSATEQQLDLALPRGRQLGAMRSGGLGKSGRRFNPMLESLQRLKRMPAQRTAAEDRNYYAAQTNRLKRNIAEVETRQKQDRERRVTLARKYRIGELPDVQIQPREILGPLQILTQKDPEMSRTIFAKLSSAILATGSSLHHGTAQMHQADAPPEETDELVQRLLSVSQFKSSPFVGAMLQILLDSDGMACDPNTVARAAAETGNEQLGILLLEKRLMCMAQHQATHMVTVSEGKRTRTTGGRDQLTAETQANTMQLWIHTAQLYKSIAAMDVYHGIYENKLSLTDRTREAVDYETIGEYMEAKEIYNEALDDMKAVVTDEERLIWKRRLLECHNRLFEWGDVERLITSMEGNPLQLLDTGTVSPNINTYLRAQLQLSTVVPVPGLSMIASPESAVQRGYMEANFPFACLMALMGNDYNRSRHYIRRAVRDFVERFASLGPFAREGRTRLLGSLQRIAELSEAVTQLRSGLDLDRLLAGWRKRLPQESDDIDIWADLAMTREAVLNRWPKTELQGSASAAIRASKNELSCALSRAAYSQYNFHLATKCLSSMMAADGARAGQEGDAQAFHAEGILEGLYLNVARIASVHTVHEDKAAYFANLAANIRYYKDSINALPEPMHSSFVYAEASAFWAVLTQAVECPDIYAPLLMHNKKVARAIAAKGHDVPETLSGLAEVFSRIAHAGFSASQQATDLKLKQQAQQALAQQCDQVLRWVESNNESVASWSRVPTEEYASIVVRSVLGGMESGDATANEMFPRLLQILDMFSLTCELFERLSFCVPIWMLLRWIPQMTAVLDKASGRAVLVVLQRIAETFPDAIVFPLQISAGQYSFSTLSTITADDVEILLSRVKSPILDRFMLELRRMTEPEHIFKDWLEQTEALLDTKVPNRRELLLDHFKEMHDLCLESSTLSNDSGLDFAGKHRSAIVGLLGQNGEKLANFSTASPKWKQVKKYHADHISRKHHMPSGRLPLDTYSPWLMNYRLSDDPAASLAIPGQFEGVRGPVNPADIVRISSFHPTVLVMESMRRPKRLTMIGTDEKEYPFLVKGGEDLRLDQRVEQTFSMMNGIISRNRKCRDASLSIHLYKVVPMTSTLGVLEWVDDTKPLRQCMADMDGFTVATNKARHAYEQFVGRFRGSSKNVGELYGSLFMNAKPRDVMESMRSVKSMVGKPFFKMFMQNLAASPEAFLSLRSEFSKSWASLSIASYILGIGDRHIDNFLVDLKCGQIVGIDFGHAFGSATEILPVPELVPFRLTNQIEEFMLPLGSAVLLEPHMVSVMAALREKRDTIMTALDIFAKEPLMEWRKFAITQFKKNLSRSGGSSSSSSEYEIDANSIKAPKWYPQQKLDIAARKLRGEHPSHIQAIELRWGHETKPYYAAALAALMGTEERDPRARVGQQCASVREQVQCLIDQATDPNILGRAWVGWSSWC
ncbi:hypothetical protein BC831DRAFT_508515 [Entophlyctis helioformis]|nr:hypothetical protein BC831DRAFT_508515 [Entophlyctis helioformis]